MSTSIEGVVEHANVGDSKEEEEEECIIMGVSREEREEILHLDSSLNKMDQIIQNIEE